jgi:hypothetical protein
LNLNKYFRECPTIDLAASGFIRSPRVTTDMGRALLRRKADRP